MFLFIQAEIVASIVILLLPPTKRVKELPQRTQLEGGITPGGIDIHRVAGDTGLLKRT